MKNMKVLAKGSVVVNYDLSVEQAIESANFDRVDDTTSYFTNGFAPNGSGSKTVNFELIHFEGDISGMVASGSMEDVQKKFDECGLRHANLQELLAVVTVEENIWLWNNVAAAGMQAEVVMPSMIGYRRAIGCPRVYRGGRGGQIKAFSVEDLGQHCLHANFLAIRD